MAAIDKAKGLVSDLKKYWKTAPEGRYMPFKEIASLSVGGIGVKMVYYCVNQMILTSTNVLIGNTIGIDPTPLYIIYILSILSSFPLTALRAKMIDNSRSMKGKYRPYIISMGIPTFLLGCGFIWMPYENMSLMWKCVAVLMFNIAFQFFFNFYNDSYDSLINVLSPNSFERSDVLSIKSVVENFSPSVINIIMPLLARAITGQNTLYDLKIYRFAFPVLMALGVLISVLIYVNTEEKIVQAKTHVIQVKFMDAFRAIARNKYFWIFSLAGWLGFLEGAMNNLIQWMYNYQGACSAGQYSIIVAIAGNASFWPNLIAPFLIRKYGKKKILVTTNILNIFFIALMLPVVRMTNSKGIIWILLACTFVNTFITCLGHLLGPSINADIRDYQQYITGERIDGMFAAVGLIGNVITLVTGLAIPAIYQQSGLNKEMAISLGYDGSNVYDVLYDPELFVRISSVLVIASVVGAMMNVVPMFFYNLSEAKQEGMVNVLKIRALFEDYSNNVLQDDALVEAVEIIKSAKKYEGAEQHNLAQEKRKLKALKRSTSKAEYKNAVMDYKALCKENVEIEIASYVISELNRFETDNGKNEIANAEKFVKAGMNGFLDVEIMSRAEAKALPSTTVDERNYKCSVIMQIDSVNTARKARQKYFPNGVVEFDSSIFETLFSQETENAQLINDAIQALKLAKETKRKNDVKEIKAMLAALQKEKDSIAKKIKDATNQNSIYYRSAKPYLDAKKLIAQKENYQHLDEIEALYNSVNKNRA